MPYVKGDFQYSRSEAYANLTSDRYGQEAEERIRDLVNVENGVRKHWADKLRKYAEGGDPQIREFLAYYLDLLDPYSDRVGDDGAFGETKVQGEGTRSWPTL